MKSTRRINDTLGDPHATGGWRWVKIRPRLKLPGRSENQRIVPWPNFVNALGDRGLQFLLALATAFLIAQLAWPTLQNWINRPRPGVQVPQQSEFYNYLLYLPRQCDQVNRKSPLLVFLHGSGQRGGDLQSVARCGPPALISGGRHLPMAVASPQCPSDRTWDVQALEAFVEHLCNQIAIDRDRVYVTGYSMGGFGAWELAAAAPRRFAAIAPLCGGSDPRHATSLVDLPIWAFHGEQDDIVPLQATQDIIDALNAAGGQPRLTVLPAEGHGICDGIYQMPELYQWLLSQRRGRDATQ